MLIIMKKNHRPHQLEQVAQAVAKRGYIPRLITTERFTAISLSTLGFRDQDTLRSLEGVEAIVEPSTVNCPTPVLPASPELRLNHHRLSRQNFTVIAGPCAVESEEQTYEIARSVKQSGAHLLRGGAFKPRTSPYSFQGLGLSGLKILKEVGRDLQMPIVTEVLDLACLEQVYEHTDMIQIGARSMYHFALLKEVGKLDKPVMLKRGMAATISEWLLAAEYILKGGNDEVLICERGIRSFEPLTRNTLDLGAVVLAKQLSHLPVAVDPSHACGRADAVPDLTLAALASGADAVMLEVHHQPAQALCDGPQALTPNAFAKLMDRLRPLAKALGKTMD